MNQIVEKATQQGFPESVIQEFIQRNVGEKGMVSKGAVEEAQELFGLKMVYDEDDKYTLPTTKPSSKPTKLLGPPLSDSVDHHGYEKETPGMYPWVPCVQFCGVLIYYTTFFSIVAFTVLAMMYMLSQEIFWYQRVTA